MATLTVETNSGAVSIEAGADEAPAVVAARLATGVTKAGGIKGTAPPSPPTRHERMSAWQLLECAACKMWLAPTQAAAERHNRKYHSELREGA